MNTTTSFHETTLLNEREVAGRLGVGQSTLARWRAQGYGPAFIRLSARRLAYRTSEIQRWVETREQQPGNVPANSPQVP